MTSDQIIQFVTPIIVPLVLAGVKQVLPRLQSWWIPVLAPVLGILIELVQRVATDHSGNLLVAASLGVVGVGLREIKEAVRPAPNGGWPTP